MQITLFSEAIDDYISDPVRVTDWFTGSLDMQELGYLHSDPQSTGRPPLSPRHVKTLPLRIYEPHPLIQTFGDCSGKKRRVVVAAKETKARFQVHCRSP